MNIREWFGIKGNSISHGETEKSLNELLTLYATALKRYFDAEHASNVYEVLNHAKRQYLSNGQKMFLEWLESKGAPYFNELSSSEIPDNEQLRYKIEYEIYLLETELDDDSMDEIRSCLVDIVNDLPNYISVAKDESIVNDSHIESLYEYLSKMIDSTHDLEFDLSLFSQTTEHLEMSFATVYEKKENYNIMPKKKEPAIIEQVLFYFWEG
jgi:hypothetical protein